MKIGLWFGFMVAMSLLTIVAGINGNTVAVTFGVLSASGGATRFMWCFVEAVTGEDAQVTPDDQVAD